MFYNITNIKDLDISSNNLTTFELWLIQVQTLIDCSNNRISHFTNNNNIDLSKYESHITQQILFENNLITIDLNDGILEMYNRCQEIEPTYPKILMEAIKRIHHNNSGLFTSRCSCDQYYIQEYITSTSAIDFSTCGQNINYPQMCNYQTSFDAMNIHPSLCKIRDYELCKIPELIKADLCDSVSVSSSLIIID
jgi:hypothetical protein